jgi:hypothetical protein
VGGKPPGRAALALAHALTWLLKLDVVLFGGIRTGPFFGLLRGLPRGRSESGPAIEAGGLSGPPAPPVSEHA